MNKFYNNIKNEIIPNYVGCSYIKSAVTWSIGLVVLTKISYILYKTQTSNYKNYKKNILNNDVLNDDILNDDILNDDILNDDVLNDDISSFNILNDDILNDDILNDDILNDDILNDDILNDDILNDDKLFQKNNIENQLSNSWCFLYV